MATYLKQYDSYPIYTDGSYKKTKQAYVDIFLADNGLARPDRITAGVSIIIAPTPDDWQANDINDWKANKDTPLLCIYINDGSAIGAQSV